jgi:hypothetical protein
LISGARPVIGAGAAGDGDVSSSDEHAGADDVAAIDGIAEGNIAERAVGAHVAHGGEAGFERHAGVGHGFEGDPGGGFGELNDGIGAVVAIGEVSVAVDEAGQHGHLGEVDNLGVGGNCEIASYRLDFIVADEDDLMVENGGGVWVD